MQEIYINTHKNIKYAHDKRKEKKGLKKDAKERMGTQDTRGRGADEGGLDRNSSLKALNANLLTKVSAQLTSNAVDGQVCSLRSLN